MAIELPKVKTVASRKNPKTLIFYSPPKTGKTTLLSLLDNCLILDLEEGAELIDALKMNIIGLYSDTKETQEQIDVRHKSKKYYLKEVGQAIIEQGRPYKYIAIDTISKLEEWAEEEGTKLYMASPTGKNFNRIVGTDKIDRSNYQSVLTLPNGAGYLWLRTAFNNWIERLYKLADHVILVGHIKDKSIEKAGKEVSAKDLDLTGKLKSISCAKADAIGYLYRDGKQVFMNFVGSDEILCGSRCKHLRGQNILLAESNKDNELVEAYWNKIYVD